MTLTIGDFHAFCLEKGEEAYDYGSNGNCALAQFFLSSGYPKITVGGYTFWNGEAIYTFTNGIGSALSGNDTFAAVAADLAYLDPSLPIGVPA